LKLHFGANSTTQVLHHYLLQRHSGHRFVSNMRNPIAPLQPSALSSASGQHVQNNERSATFGSFFVEKLCNPDSYARVVRWGARKFSEALRITHRN
jgi:hypothetical protein